MKVFPSTPPGDGRIEKADVGLQKPLESRFAFGAAVGVISGFVTIPAMILFTFVYAAIATRHLGSTTVLAFFMPAILSIVVGGIVGAIAGKVAGRLGVGVHGARAGAGFGACLMTLVGLMTTLLDFATGPDRFAEWALFCVGLDLVSPIVAGILVGAIFGAATRSANRAGRSGTGEARD